MARRRAARAAFNFVFQIGLVLEEAPDTKYVAFRHLWESLKPESKALCAVGICDALEPGDVDLAAEISLFARYLGERYIKEAIAGIDAHKNSPDTLKVDIRNTCRELAKAGRATSSENAASLEHLFSPPEACPSPPKKSKTVPRQPAPVVPRKPGDIAPAGDPGRMIGAVSHEDELYNLKPLGVFSLNPDRAGALHFTAASGVKLGDLRKHTPAVYALVVRGEVAKIGGSACEEGILTSNIKQYCEPSHTKASRWGPREQMHQVITNGGCAEYYACFLPKLDVPELPGSRHDFRVLESQKADAFKLRNGEYPECNAKERGKSWNDIFLGWRQAGWVPAARNSPTCTSTKKRLRGL
jgi:hypothetical protein